jgi:hypothetical protein
MLSKSILLPMVAACLASSVLGASESCDAAFTQRYREDSRFLDSLRLDKPAQARVFALDGSEFTAGQVWWMKGRLRLVDRACARGQQTEAMRLLSEVEELRRSRKHTS